MTTEETLQHLIERGVDPKLYERSLVVSEGLATFMLADFDFKWVGYQEYRPFAERNCKNVREARYFTYLPRKVNGYFGLPSLTWSSPSCDRIYLVEGVFKAAKLHRLGYAAIALMGSETKQHKPQLSLIRRPLIAIGDADAAGEKFAKSLGGFTSPRDLDEMSDEEVLELCESYNAV